MSLSELAKKIGTSAAYIEFDMDGKPWRYRLVASSERVHAESLHVKQSRTYSYVFTRQWDLGLSDVRLQKQTITRDNGETEDVYLPFTCTPSTWLAPMVPCLSCDL